MKTLFNDMATEYLGRVRRAHHHTGFNGPHVAHLANGPVSTLAPFAALILTISTVILFLFRLCVIERFLLRTKRYRCHFDRLGPIQQCTFINHHVAAACKIVLLFSAAYPFLAVAFGHSTLQSPVVPYQSPTAGHRPTNGDVLVVCAQIFAAMYIFELFFRRTISVISAAHHIGAIVITQSALAIALNFQRERDATIEFVLCFVWGTPSVAPF